MARQRQYTLNPGDIVQQPLGFRAHTFKCDNPGGMVITELNRQQQIPAVRLGAVLAVDTDLAWVQAVAATGASNVGPIPAAIVTYTEDALPQAPGTPGSGVGGISYVAQQTGRSGVFPPIAANNYTFALPAFGQATAGQTYRATRLQAHVMASAAAVPTTNNPLAFALEYRLGAGGSPNLDRACQGVINPGATVCPATDIDVPLNYPFAAALNDFFALIIFTATGANMTANQYWLEAMVWYEPAQ